MIAAQFSIVVPTRARAESLALCLEKLRPQLAEVVAEVIVTDDGGSADVKRMIESRFGFARWTPGPQRGPAANRNHGAALSEGEFILFLDDDVEPSPNLLASYRAAIQPAVNVYEGRTTCQAGLRSPLEHAPINETGGCLWSCNMMVRKSFWSSFGGFDEDFPYPHLEDVVFRERLEKAGERVAFVARAWVDHPPRRLPAGATLARQHESYFVYQYKYLSKRPSVDAFFRHLVGHRVRNILRYPVSRDSALALGSMCAEGWYVMRHWRQWDDKWRARLGA
jgi:GT2 family glycosyltransferase